MAVKISIVIPVKNEELRIRRCLDSLKGWVDEIIILDDNSDDRTAVIACEEYGAVVIKQSLEKDWSKQRNRGALASRNDWILQLDADEVVPRQTARIIENVLNKDVKEKAFSLTRVNVLANKPLLHCGAGEYVRLYDRRSAAWEGEVHEQLRVQGCVAKIDGCIEHYPVDSMEYFLGKNLFYARISAGQFVSKVASLEAREIRSRLTVKVLKLFWKSYVRKKGYRDGMQGLIWCVLNIMTSQMYWLMVWEKASNSGKLK